MGSAGRQGEEDSIGVSDHLLPAALAGMTLSVGLIERSDPRSPSFDERSAALALAGVHRELRETPEAIALARIAAVARSEAVSLDRPAPDSPGRAAFNVCLDAFVMARDELDNLIHLACQSRDLERVALPSTGEMVDRLARND